MKDFFISEVSKHIDEEVCTSFLLEDIFYSENRYLNKWQETILVDKTGEITSRIWGELMNDRYYGFKGKVVKAMGRVLIYQNKPEIQVAAMELEKDYDWTDYVLTLDEKKAEECIAIIQEYIQMVTNPGLQQLLRTFFDSRKKRIVNAIGGTRHHNYFGGLLVHMVETCTAAVQKAKEQKKSFSPYAAPVNLDLIIAGALLHDIGKLKTYGCFPKGERTSHGMLVNASTDSLLLTAIYNSNLPEKIKMKDTTLLDHIILTAETQKEAKSSNECGQIPCTIEAVIVNEANRESMEREGFNQAFYEADRKQGEHKTKIFSKINNTYIMREVY